METWACVGMVRGILSQAFLGPFVLGTFGADAWIHLHAYSHHAYAHHQLFLVIIFFHFLFVLIIFYVNSVV